MDNEKAFQLAVQLYIESVEDKARMPFVPQTNVKYFQGASDAYIRASHKVCLTFGIDFDNVKAVAREQMKQAS